MPADAEPPADPPVWAAVFVPAPEAQAAPPAPAEALPLPVPAPSRRRLQPAPWWVAALFGLWLAGALAWYTLALVRLRRFRLLLRHAVPAPESLRQRTQRLAEKLRLRRRPAVWLVPGRVAPMLWAAGGPPRILFPADLLGHTTPEQQNALLVHELAHLRRRDHWVRWLEFAAAGLYWWNPVLWFARRELREAEEHCCDAWVTSTLPGAGKTYAVALLETLDFLSDAPPATPLMASGVGRVADLKRRLTMIMSGTTPRALSWRGLLAVLGLGALLLPLLPAWARAQPASQPKPDAPAKSDEPVLRFRIVTDAPAAADDADQARAELKMLEATMQQKQAQMAELTARIEALRAKLAKTDGQPRVPGGAAVLPDGTVMRFTAAPIVVEADGKDVRYGDLLKSLQAIRPSGQGVKIIVIDKATGKILLENEPNPPATATPAVVSADKQYILRLIGQEGKWVVVPKDEPKGPVAPPPPAPPMGPGFVFVPAPAVKPPPGDADKRLDELERKLKGILEEVEQLRQQRKPGAPESEAAPSDKVQAFRLYFKDESAATVENLRLKVQELKATAEAEKARGAAALELAKAALVAADAALKQAEVQAEAAEAKKAPADSLKVFQAEVAVRQAALQAAKANVDRAAEDQRAMEVEIEAKLRSAEAGRQAAEERVRRLEEELRKAKEAASGDAPKKP